MLPSGIGGRVGAWGSLDHFVGAGEHAVGDSQPESLRSLEVVGCRREDADGVKTQLFSGLACPFIKRRMRGVG
jgi:hypothetical protein